MFLIHSYEIDFINKCLQKVSVITHGYIEVTNYEVHVPEPIFQVEENSDGSKNKKLIMTEENCEKIKNWYAKIKK